MDPERAARVEAHVDLVRRIAASVHRQIPIAVLDDLISAGNEGLVDAALRYEPDVGIPFAHFAYRRIRGAMIDTLRRSDPASRAYRRAARSLEVAQAVLDAAAEQPVDRRTPLEDRVAAVRALVERTAVAVAMATTAGMGDGDAAAAAPDPTTPTPDEVIDHAATRDRLLAALENLAPDERALVDAVYFRDEPMATYAERIGVHKSTICRRHARAIARLSESLDRGGDAPIGGVPARRRQDIEDG